jgi:hypothetical protein
MRAELVPKQAIHSVVEVLSSGEHVCFAEKVTGTSEHRLKLPMSIVNVFELWSWLSPVAGKFPLIYEFSPFTELELLVSRSVSEEALGIRIVTQHQTDAGGPSFITVSLDQA